MAAIEKPPHVSNTTYNMLVTLPEDGEYLPALNLLTDRTIMPAIWEDLENSDKAVYFTCSIINGISFWGMHDGQSPSVNYELYLSAQKHLKGFLNAINQSADLLFNYQLCFERAIRNAHAERLFLQPAEKPNMKNIHFISLTLDIIKQADTWEKTDFDRNEKSIFPRKMKEKSAYRTYLVRVIHEALQETQKNVTYGRVANIINIMFPDEEALDETHVRKLI